MTWCFRNKLLLGKLKDTKNGVKSIFLKNMIFPKNLNLGRKSVFGENNPFLEYFWGNNCKKKTGGAAMRKKGYKGRCEKKDLSKSREVCRTYDAIQSNYADILQNDNDIQEIRCNVLLDGLSEGAYTSDFVCVKADGDLMVRECVFRKFLTKPMTVKLLDVSRDYWINHGVSDWGMVIDEE